MNYAKVTYEYTRKFPGSNTETFKQWRLMSSLKEINEAEVQWFLLTIPEKGATLIEWEPIDIEETIGLYVTTADNRSFNPKYDDELYFNGLEIDMPTQLGINEYSVKEVLRVLYNTTCRFLMAWSVIQ